MTRMLTLSVMTLCACTAGAEVKRSSTTFAPARPKASSRTGNTAPNSSTAPHQAPATEAVAQITFLGPKSGWGFVQITSPFYSLQGKKIGALPGGTPFKYSAVKSSSKNDMLVSSVKRGTAWEGPYLLDCTDIAAYEGTFETQDPQTLVDLAAFFTLKSKIEDRKTALLQEGLAANPHFESAKKAQQDYQNSLTKAAEMEAKMNTLSGVNKSKALDTLRALKYEQVRIKAKADQEAADYKTWKDAHPANSAKFAADPQLKSLEQELQQAKAKVASLVPQT